MAGKLEKQIKKRHGFDSTQQAAVLGLLRTHDLVNYRRNQFFREYGMTQPQYNALRILRGANTSLPCLEIASRMITKVPAITGLVDKLEEKKWVKKERCSKDRRVWYVSITEAGKRLLAKMDQPLLDMEKMLCCGLSKSECQQLVQLMEKMRNGIES